MGWLYYIIAINVLVGVKVARDYNLKSKGIIVNHAKSAFFDVVLYAAAGFLMSGSWLFYLSCLILSLSYRWIVFDIVFNLVNGWKWNHLGNSSNLDLFLKKFKYPLVVKLIPLIFGSCLLLLS